MSGSVTFIICAPARNCNVFLKRSIQFKKFEHCGGKLPSNIKNNGKFSVSVMFESSTKTLFPDTFRRPALRADLDFFPHCGFGPLHSLLNFIGDKVKMLCQVGHDDICQLLNASFVGHITALSKVRPPK